MSNVFLAATVASITCLAACGAERSNEPPPPVGTAGSATVGPSGGSVAATLAGGGSVVLTIPSGAVGAPTAFAIEPIAAAAPALVRFLLRPASVVFDADVILTVTVPADLTLPQLAMLGYRVGAARVFVPVSVDAARRRVEARLRSLGTAADPLSDARASGPHLALRAAPGDAEFSIEVSVIATIIAAADAAIARMQAEQTVAAADALNTTMSAVTVIPQTPELEPQLRPLFDRWRSAVCNRFAAVLTQYAGVSTASPFDFPDYYRETDIAVAWTGTAQVLGDLAESVALTECPGGGQAGIDAIRAKTVEFIARVQAIVDATDVAVRFDEVLDNRLPGFLRFERELTLMQLDGLLPNARALSGRFLDRIRAAGYRFCQGQVGRLYYLARLLEEEQGSVGGLSTYDEGSLVADLGACATELQWRALDSLGGTVAQGVLGGIAPDVAVLQAATTLPVGGSIRFEGLVRPLQCTGTSPPDFTLNQETLRFDVRHGLQTQSAGTHPLPSGLPAEYFRDGPRVLTGAQLRSAVGLSASEAAVIDLRVVRVGNVCGFPMDALPSPSTMASLTVTLAGAGPPPATVATGGYDGTFSFDDGGIIVQPVRWWLLPEGGQFYVGLDNKSPPFNAAPPVFLLPLATCDDFEGRCSGLFTLPTAGGSFQVVVNEASGATTTWTGSVGSGVLNVVRQGCGESGCSNPGTFTGTFAVPFPGSALTRP